jgi:hypothetical protein
MKTGAHLKIQSMGDNVLGVRLFGNPQQPEPGEFRVCFPGGDLSVTRCTDGTYWAHVRVEHEGHPAEVPDDIVPSRIVAARLDLLDKHTSEANVGDFNNPNLYHVAFRIARKIEAATRTPSLFDSLDSEEPTQEAS